MNKVLVTLVEQRYNRNSLSVLAAALSIDSRLEGVDVHFADGRRLCEVLPLAERYASVIVAFSFASPNLWEVAGALSNLRRQLGHTHAKVCVVAGGPHPSGDPCGTLRIGFDFVVMGEGERSFPELVALIAEERDPYGVPGLAWLDGVRLRRNPRARPIDLDAYPPFAHEHRKFGPIEITRGCPWGCSFCQTPRLFGGRLRHRSVANVCAHVQTLLRHGWRDVRFITPDAFSYGSCRRGEIDLGKIQELLRAVSGMAGKEHVYFGTFPSEIRPEAVSRGSLELICKYTANTNLVIGAQSGSERVLRLMHRGHTVSDVFRATKLVKDAGLAPNLDFIFGYPGETSRDRAMTRKVIEELVGMGGRVHSHAFMPLPGTPLANAKPGEIDRETRRLLGRLAKEGSQYGQWERQEKIARELRNPRPANAREALLLGDRTQGC